MRIIPAYARLLPPPHVDISEEMKPFEKEHGLQLLRRVEWYARISHRSEDKQTKDSYERFLRTWVMEHGDFSTIEHCGISADLVVDRGLSHELVRHRLAKIADENFDLALDIDVAAPEVTQESTRFVNYGKGANTGVKVILPPELVPVHECSEHLKRVSPNDTVGPMDLICPRDEKPLTHEEATRLSEWYEDWMTGVKQSEERYLRQISLKVAPELARDMLPHCTATRMIMTHNLRNWRHLMIMRTTTETHRKLRPLMQDILVELKENVPVLFDDLQPDQKQSKNLQKGR